MKISWNWLSSLVDTEGLTPQEVGDVLTLAGLEVEGVEHYAFDPTLDTIVVGHIDTIEPHPKADKLVVVMVDAGDKGRHQVVCGATNMKAGDKVPFAMPGTRMPGEEEFIIKTAKLRGVESGGMLCSARELELSLDHAGLMILSEDATPGTPVLDALAMHDQILEVGLTPNRPDGLGHLGMAREVSALLGRKLKWPTQHLGWQAAECRGEATGVDQNATFGAETGEPIASLLKVKLEDPHGCPRYAAAVLTGVKVGPSPKWLQTRLMAIGQRSINNLVDVTNYVSQECGQPMHAFDLDKLADHTIVIRRGKEGEALTTIDDVERKLTTDDVIIADANVPIAVAGVMGGADSGVSEGTTRLALECAYFNPTLVRKTSRRLGMHTDSSHRFERGTDPNGVPWFMRRAIELLMETQRELGVTPKLAEGIIDLYPAPIAPKEVVLPVKQYHNLIGVELSAEVMVETLNRIDIVARIEGDALHVRVPTFRPDIERPVDVIEEIARVQGYENIEPELPMGRMGEPHTERPEADTRADTIVTREDEAAIKRARTMLLDNGLRESVNYTFVDGSTFDALGLSDDDPRKHPIRLRNPLASDMDVMRTTLMTGLLSNVSYNRAHKKSDVCLFEVGRVYLRHDLAEAPLPDNVGGPRWGIHAEPLHIAGVLTGQRDNHFTGRKAWDVYDVRGVVQDLVETLTRKPMAVGALSNPPGMLHPYACGALTIDGVHVGWMGSLHPDTIKAFDISGVEAVYGFELDLTRLLVLRSGLSRMTSIPKFPAAQRDFALSVPSTMAYRELEDAIQGLGEPRLVDYTLFDVYEGEQIEAGRKSLAINVTFLDPEGTLSEDELVPLQERLVAHLAATLDARQR